MEAWTQVLEGDETAVNLNGRHWRALSYEHYTGRGWTLSSEQTEKVRAFEAINLPPAAEQALINQNVDWIYDKRATRYTLGQPVQFNQPVVVSWRGVEDLVRHVLPDLDDSAVDRITRRVLVDSAGLPLLATELLTAVRLGLELDEVGGVWPQPFRTMEQTYPSDLPDSVVAAIRIGFRRLSRPAQAVLAAASVLDERCETDFLSLATGLEGDELHDALDELEWNRWLVAEQRGYAFVARIVRDVVARDMLTPGQRRRIQEAVSGA